MVSGEGIFMAKLIAQRLLSIIPLLLGISIIVFMMVQLVPGDPVRTLVGDDSTYTPAQLDELRATMGLDRPLYVQYLDSLWKMLHGDFGDSLREQKPAFGQIVMRIPSTLQLTCYGMIFAIIGGLTIGIISALHHNKLIDNILSLYTAIGVGIPNFWMGLMFMIIFCIKLKWLPVLSTPKTGFKGIILPAVTIGFHSQVTIARFVRSGMIEVMHNDYIRTARAKGAAERRVTFMHGLRNALIPVITIIGIQFGSLMAGAAVTETVFNRDGIGRILVTSITAKDYPMVQAALMIVAFFYIIINMIVDILYTYLDPRIRIS